MPQSELIVLSTINATYAHPSFGLRRLLAGMGALRPQTRLLEFFRRPPVERIVDDLLACRPQIVGFGVYIWNVRPLTDVVRRLNERAPETIVVLGGPEVSHAPSDHPIVESADYVICGEGDLAFGELCRRLRRGERPGGRLLRPAPPDPAQVPDPYDEYDDEDLARRVLYVETSRGCPFHCEYCLSSLDAVVRFFPLDRVLADLDRLLGRGARRFKFIDRTFNLKTDRCVRVLEFFLDRLRPGLSIQFEVVPTRMPQALREVIRRFPPETLRLEVGVQTFSKEVLERIRRRQDAPQTHATLRFLTEETRAVVHADLIAGLPGEDLAGFGRSFNALLRWRPAEVQVGILKRLPGVPIARHDQAWGMRYRSEPPYDLLASDCLSETDMTRLRRFARYWDLIWNSGRFPRSAPLLLDRSPSAFDGFLAFSDWLFARIGATHGISLLALVEALFHYLTGPLQMGPGVAAAALAEDYQRDACRALPRFLKRHLPAGRGISA